MPANPWLAALAGGVSGAAQGLTDGRAFRAQAEEKARKEAATQSEYLKQLAQSYAEQGNFSAVNDTLPGYLKATNTATGLNLQGPRIPTTHQVTDVDGVYDLETHQPLDKKTVAGTDFNDAGVQAALRGAFQLDRPKPLSVAGGTTLFDPSTNKPIYTAPIQVNPNQQYSVDARTATADARMRLQQAIATLKESGADRRLVMQLEGRLAQIDRQGGVQATLQDDRQAHADQTKDRQSFDDLIDEVSQMPGVKITSLYRTPEQNAGIKGATPNGHNGYQIDMEIPPPEHQQAIRQAMAARGLELIDKPHGSGPHWHFQVPQDSRVRWTPTRRKAGQGAQGTDRSAALLRIERILTTKYPDPKPTAFKTKYGQPDSAAWQAAVSANRAAREAEREQLMRDAGLAGAADAPKQPAADPVAAWLKSKGY